MEFIVLQELVLGKKCNLQKSAFFLAYFYFACIMVGKKSGMMVAGGQLQILGGLSRSTILLHIVHRFSKGVDGKRKKCVCL